MDRKRKLYAAKAAVVMGALPLLLWAYEYGPDPGYVGVPGENGGVTCANSNCHAGIVNNPANKGSVTVNFPNGQTYAPGVKQQLSVTVADPATTQASWGFELSARVAATPSSMAGTFTSTDVNTQLMCSQPNLQVYQTVGYSQSGSQICPASATLQYIEHSLLGYQASFGHTLSYTYQFNWTPPSTNVGNIAIYVAANAAVGKLPTGNTPNPGDHIYSAKFTLTSSTGGSAPAITGVSNAAGGQNGVVPDSYASIYGTNLASVTDNWNNSIVDGKLPTTLDGVSVTVGGKPAYISFISSGQINIQTPDAGTGSMPVVVTTSVGASAAFTTTSQTAQPAFFPWNSSTTIYAVATRNSDNSLAVKNGVFASTTTPAKPGDVLILWCTGLGPTTPTVAAGIAVPASATTTYNTSNPASVTVGGVGAMVYGAALAQNFAGLYQVAIQVPASAPNGDLPIVLSINGAQSPANVFLTVHN